MDHPTPVPANRAGRFTAPVASRSSSAIRRRRLIARTADVSARAATSTVAPSLDSPEACAAIILAGGQSTRMGTNKALLPLPGEPHLTFVQHLASTLTPLCTETILVARDADDAANYTLPGVQIITDQVAGYGPLMGLYSGLNVIHTERALVLAVDMPFVQPALLSFLLAQSSSETLLVPVVNDVPQVLLAVYPRIVLPLIEQAIQQGRRGPRSLLELAPVKYVAEDRLRLVDPELRSFININTPQDLRSLPG